MKDLEYKLKNLLKTSGHLKKGATIIVASSGGVDSMALTSLLESLREEMHLTIYVMHVQHHLRGKEAERDAKLVEDYAKFHKLNFIRADVDVLALVKKEGLSVEEAARKLRYTELENARKRVKGSFIFLAHHEDDQAETVLLNLLRGTGSRGLRGMLSKNGYLVRPLLKISKEDLILYCEEKNIKYCFDSSNNDTEYKRNWTRKKLLPLLEKINPNIKKTLANTAILAARDEDALAAFSLKYFKKYSRVEKDQCSLEINLLQKKTLAIFTRVIKLSLEIVSKEDYSFRHIEDVRALIAKGVSGKSINLPKIKVLYQYGKIIVSKREKKSKAQKDKTLEIVLKIPGEVKLPYGEILQAEIVKQKGKNEKNAFYYPRELIVGPILVRTRRPGDKFRPSGTGEKKLKDFLIDKKIPQKQRDNLFVVATGDTVLWILGVRQSGWKNVGIKKEFIKLTLRRDEKNEQ